MERHWENACQVEHSTAPILTSPHVSYLGHPRCKHLSHSRKLPLGLRVRVWFWRTTMPTSSTAQGWEKACQGEHITAPTLLHPQLADLDDSWDQGHHSMPSLH